MMNNLSNSRLIRLYQLFSKIIGVIVALTGVIVLVGWFFAIFESSMNDYLKMDRKAAGRHMYIMTCFHACMVLNL